MGDSSLARTPIDELGALIGAVSKEFGGHGSVGTLERSWRLRLRDVLRASEEALEREVEDRKRICTNLNEYIDKIEAKLEESEEARERAEERGEEMRQARNGANLEKSIARQRVADLERENAELRAKLAAAERERETLREVISRIMLRWLPSESREELEAALVGAPHGEPSR